MKAFASLLALALATSAQAQLAAGLQPARVDDIFGATQACLRAARPGRVDEAVLRAGSWKAATMSANGKAVASPLRVYGREGGRALIVFANAGTARGLCTVMARVARASSVGEVAGALERGFKAKPAEVKPDRVTWSVAGKLVVLQATGSAQAPSIRIGVQTAPRR